VEGKGGVCVRHRFKQRPMEMTGGFELVTFRQLAMHSTIRLPKQMIKMSVDMF